MFIVLQMPLCLCIGIQYRGRTDIKAFQYVPRCCMMLMWNDNIMVHPALLEIVYQGKALYLSLCEVQVYSDLVATQPGQVVMVGELCLQFSQLLLGECCAFFSCLAAGIHLKAGLLDIWKEKGISQSASHLPVYSFKPEIPNQVSKCSNGFVDRWKKKNYLSIGV